MLLRLAKRDLVNSGSSMRIIARRESDRAPRMAMTPEGGSDGEGRRQARRRTKKSSRQRSR